MLNKILILIFVILIIPTCTYATDAIIESQLEVLNLSSFIQEGEKYTKDIFEDIDMQSFFKSAITGKIDTKTIYSTFLSVLGDEIVSSITILGGVLGVIVIHAILKNVGENICITDLILMKSSLI